MFRIFQRTRHHIAIPSAPHDHIANDPIDDDDDDEIELNELENGNVEVMVTISPRDAEDRNHTELDDVSLDDNEENWNDEEETSRNNAGGSSAQVINFNNREGRRQSSLEAEVNRMILQHQRVDDSEPTMTYRSIFDLQEEMAVEQTDQESVRLRRIMLVACVIPITIFILLSVSYSEHEARISANSSNSSDVGNDSSESDASSAEKNPDDGNYQLFSILFFMSFMNILCAFFERTGSGSTANASLAFDGAVPLGSSPTAASIHLMSFEAQLTAAILESRRVQLLELLGRTDEINAMNASDNVPTGVSEGKRNTWKKYNYQPDEKEADQQPTCSICLCEYEPGESIIRLPCDHEYHEQCLLNWTSTHVRCPLCNFNLEDDELNS